MRVPLYDLGAERLGDGRQTGAAAAGWSVGPSAQPTRSNAATVNRTLTPVTLASARARSGGQALPRRNHGDELAGAPPPERERDDLGPAGHHQPMDVVHVANGSPWTPRRRSSGEIPRSRRESSCPRSGRAPPSAGRWPPRKLGRQLLAPGGDAEVAAVAPSAAHRHRGDPGRRARRHGEAHPLRPGDDRGVDAPPPRRGR